MKFSLIKKSSKCRVCKEARLVKVLSFGPTPAANAFLTKKQIDLPENFYPLDVYFCKNCTLLQLGHVISPEILFDNYVYVSSTSPVFVNHFAKFARDQYRRFRLNSESLIVDIGSNDGILLNPFKLLGTKVLGIEPARHIAKIAEKKGIHTMSDFFSTNLSRRIVARYGKAKIVTATNVFAHIDDLDEVITGIKILMADDGVFIMEVPSLMDFIKKRYFDLVYHEHLSYFAVKPLVTLFERFGMKIFDIRKVSSHGGSMRVFVKKSVAPYKITKNVSFFIKAEKKAKLDDINTYFQYRNMVLENRVKLMNLLVDLKLKGSKIAGFGAPAKGNTLLNYFKIGPEILDYIIEDSPFKQNLFAPGTRIPVVSPDKLKKDPADYILILAWNFAIPIMEKLGQFKGRGGKFIIPVPNPKVI